MKTEDMMAEKKSFFTLERVQKIYEQFEERNKNGFISLKPLIEEFEEGPLSVESTKFLEGVPKFVKTDGTGEEVKKDQETPSSIMEFIKDKMNSKETSGMSLEELNEVLDKFTEENGENLGFTPVTDADLDDLELYINFKGFIQVTMNYLKLLFEKVDKDKNGQITKSEMKAFFQDQFQKKFREVLSDSDSDSDLDGFNEEDIEEYKMIPIKMMSFELAHVVIISDLDQDGDRKVSFEELFESLFWKEIKS